MARRSKTTANEKSPSDRSTAKVFRGAIDEDVVTEKPEVVEEKKAPVEEDRDDDYKDAVWFVKIIYSIQDFLNDNMDFLKYCQIMCFAYLLKIMYTTRTKFPGLLDIGPTIGFNMLGVGIMLVLSHIKQPVPEGVSKTYPEFELIYSGLLPLLVQVVHYDSKAIEYFFLANLSLNYFVGDKLNEVFRFICSIMFFQIYNETDLMSTLTFIQIAAVHYSLTYVLEHANGASNKSFKKAEIQIVALMVTNVLLNPAVGAFSPLQIFLKLLISLIAMCLLAYPIYQLVPWFVIAPLFSAGFYVLTNYQLRPVLKSDDAVMWIYNYILADDDRIFFVKVWAAILAVTIPVVFSGAELVSLNWRRKIWHFVIVAVLLLKPNILTEHVEFTLICLLGLTVIFILVEIVRYTQYTPIGKFLYTTLRKFQDGKDQGPLNLSYIYLNLGITIPILYDYFQGKVTITSYVGLVTLGLGDSFALIVGKRFGSIKWKGGQKSVQGSVTFVAVSMLAFRILDDILKAQPIYEPIAEWEHVFVATCLTAVLEGTSLLNDNLFVPIVWPVTYEVLSISF